MEKKYCAAPWRGLHINPRGDVKTCCAGNPNMLGNLNQDSISNILANPILTEIRDTVKQGILHPEYCHNCIEIERYGPGGERQWHNEVNEEFDCTVADNNDYQPSIFDVRWNTTCNLMCNYCDDNASSRWAVALNKPVHRETQSYYEDVCAYIESNGNNLREVALVGGEPLLLKENERLLDIIPEDTLVTVITNLSVDLDKNLVFQKLKQRPRVSWSISLDNTLSKFEYVRSGAKWLTMANNVRQVTELFKQGHYGGIHAVYNIYSATNLCEFKEWADQQGMNILWQTLHAPAYLDPVNLGPTVAELAAREITKYLGTYVLKEQEKTFLLSVKQRLETAANANQVKQFRQHIQSIETKYHRHDSGKFIQHWPELAFLLETT